MTQTAAAPAPAALPDHLVRQVVFGVLTAMLLASLNQTIVITALPTLGREFGDPEGAAWVVTAYLVAATAVTPLYGKLSDIHGRRIVLGFAIVLFMVGAVACALAPGMGWLIAARALQGLGGGGLYALSQTIIGDVVPPKERPRYQVYTSIVFVTASLAGPAIGGLIVDRFSWPVIFLVNIPVGALALWSTYTTLRLLPRHERPHKLDVVGAGLMVFATVCLMVGLSWAGHRYAWGSPQVLGMTAASAMGWLLFALRLKSAEEPFIPAGVLGDPLVRSGILSASFGMGVFIGFMTYTPIFLETVFGLTPGQSGLAMMPLMAGEVTGAFIAGRVIARTPHYKRAPLAGLAGSAAAVAALAIGAVAMPLPLPVVIVLLAVVSVGLGTLLPVTTLSVQNAVARHQLGAATGALNFFRQLASALAVAVFGAILFRGGSAGLAGEAAHSAALVAAGFQGVCLAAAFGFLAAWGFLSRMEARPLRGLAKT